MSYELKAGDLKLLKEDSLILFEGDGQVIADLTDDESWVMIVEYPSAPKNLCLDSSNPSEFTKVIHPTLGCCWIASTLLEKGNLTLSEEEFLENLLDQQLFLTNNIL